MQPLLQGTGGREHLFRPFDLAVDPVSRVLFWTCAETNSVNITRMDDGDDNDEKDYDAIVEGEEDQGRLTYDVRRGCKGHSKGGCENLQTRRGGIPTKIVSGRQM